MSSLAQLNTLDLSAVARDLISAGQIMGTRGWVPATSGNLSCRIDAGTIAITASGIDKSSLQPQHILTVSLNEPPPRNASAETGLHVAAYHRDAEIGAVLHVHSLNATLLSRRFASQGCVKLSGFELFKAFAGFKTHDVAVEVPIFANSQDVPVLAQKVEAGLSGGPKLPGYLLAGHGLYTWGRNLGEAMRHLEAFEFLFSCVMAEV